MRQYVILTDISSWGKIKADILKKVRALKISWSARVRDRAHKNYYWKEIKSVGVKNLK